MAKAISTTQKTICVMIGDVDVSHDFSAELTNGIFDTAYKEGVRLLFLLGMPRHAKPTEQVNKGTLTYHHNSIYDYAYMFGADAYIFSCGFVSGFESENAYLEFLKRFEGTPYVILQDNIKITVPSTSYITFDNYNSYCQCIEHLIQVHGQRKITFLGGVEGHPDTKERLLAYRDTMEKHGLPVTETMIAYGDFSEFSDNQASQLIDHNPGLEAIACCNDEMAIGCYRVCAKLGLKVGKDIAITGFDNFTSSRTLIPPLTTVSQNIYQMGKTAILQAIALAEGKRVDPVKLKTRFLIRRSCGCYPDAVSTLFMANNTDNEPDINIVIKNIATDLVNAYALSEQKQGRVIVSKLADRIKTLLNGGPVQSVDQFKFSEWLQGFAEEYTSLTVIIAKRLTDYILRIPDEILRYPSMRNLYNILSFTQGFLFSYNASMNEKSLDEFRVQSWFVPELIRDLVGYDIEDERLFRSLVERLHGIHLNHIYICLLPQPQPLHNSDQLYMPTKLLVAAYHSDTGAHAYPFSQMPVIDAEHSLKNLPELNSTTHLMCFSIFSGDVQYGIFMCEVDTSQSALMHIIGLQLGILTNALDVRRKEKIVGNELENIRERNEILSFLSEYDSQCSILNRRGFIERAIRLNRENVGKHAICVFMDLDHLKEINDTFGHSHGDEALATISEMLKQTVRSKDLVARIGGDEFVGMFIIDTPEYANIFKARLKKAFDEYNQTSEHPYYVEASVGIVRFICSQGLEISKIVNDADHYLYEEKKHKRKSVLKPTP